MNLSTLALLLTITLLLWHVRRLKKRHEKQIAQERSDKEMILEQLDEGVIIFDQEMNISFINTVGSKMLGFPRRKLLSFPMPQAQDKPLLVRCHLLLDTCQKRGCSLTDSIFLGDGKKSYFDLIASTTHFILQDKSSHHKVLEMGKDFVANASHELRTPITIIKGFAETLYDMPELPREMVVAITEKIVRNCERMDNLVKNLLTLADLENLPESRFQECDLSAIAESCKEVLSSLYPNAQITIEKDSDSITVLADPDILELAVMNLMNNAAKYSNTTAEINIKLEKKDEKAHIGISDSGIGIPPEDLDHIFERFYTVDKARSRRLGGAGLGLSIVKTIAEKHNGSVSVTSMLGKGTTFTLSLPSALT